MPKTERMKTERIKNLIRELSIELDDLKARARIERDLRNKTRLEEQMRLKNALIRSYRERIDLPGSIHSIF